MKSRLDYKKALAVIKKYDTIIIHRHTSPDGDAMGSQIGLKYILQDNFPRKKIYAVGDSTQRFAFMQGSTMSVIPDETYNNALAIILDCGSASLISDNRYLLAPERLRLDHHIFGGRLAETEVVDTTFESCCGLITNMAVSCKLKISTQAATALFTGLVTDSGRFRYSSTSARTFALASALVSTGVNMGQIYTNLYLADFNSVKQRAEYVNRVKVTGQGVGYLYTTKEQLGDEDAQSISRRMVSTMSDIKGIKIWVNFTEYQDTVLCEIRSAGVNINPIAVKYGGGGHVEASGATLKNKEQCMQMLADLNVLATEK